MRDDNKHRTAGSSQGKQPITAFAPGGRGFHTTCLPHQTWQAGLPRPTGRQACPRRSTRQAGRTKDTNIRRGGSQPPKQTAETAFSPLRVYTLPGVNPPEGGVNPLWGNLSLFLGLGSRFLSPSGSKPPIPGPMTRKPRVPRYHACCPLVHVNSGRMRFRRTFCLANWK